MTKIFVGVDGGGSQTQAVVLSDTREILGRGAAGPSNHYVTGIEEAAGNCEAAAQLALLDARRIVPTLLRESVAAWGFGLAGVRRAGDAEAMRARLQLLCGARPLILDTDAAAAHAGSFTGNPGIVLSAGTGAICFGIDSAGERFYADGWGPLLGDEGGGYWIGVEAMKAVCRAADGRGPQTRMASTILSALNVVSTDELVQLVYSERCSREAVAQLAQIVFDAADAGAHAAIEIRDRAVSHLSSSAAAVARAMLARLRERSSVPGARREADLELAVALRGGLFESDFFRASVGYQIGEKMIEMKKDYLPLASWKIVKPQFEAAIGAALLAQKAAG